MVRRPQRYWILLAVCVAAVALAIDRSRDIRLDADVTALLPRGSIAASDYRLFAERFGAFEQVFVLVGGSQGGETPTRAELAHAADRLAVHLEQAPEVRSVRSGVSGDDLDRLARWLAPRALFLLDGDWLGAAASRLTPEAIDRRAALLRRRAETPVGLYASALLATDPFGFTEDLVAGHHRPAGLPTDPMTGAFVSEDGRTALLVATPAGAVTDAESGRALGTAIDRATAETRRETGLDIAVDAVGGPLYAAEDETLLRRDLEVSLAGSALGCAVLLVAAFASVRLPLVATLALAAGVALTGGWVAVGLGEVSAASLGFAAVLLGLGIDYCIHGAARYREHLGAGRPPAAALAETIRRSGPAILVSALTTAGAFAVLGLAHFRPLRELGFLMATGVLSIVATSYAVGGPLLVLLGPRRSRDGVLWRGLGRLVDRWTTVAARHATVVLGAVALLTATAGWGLSRLSIDPDLEVFRSREHSAPAAERRLVETFGLGLETAHIVVSGPDLGSALRAADRVREAVERTSEGRAVVTSPADLLVDPRRVEERRPAIAGLGLDAAVARLSDALRAQGLDPGFFAPGFETLTALAVGRIPDDLDSDPLPEGLGSSVAHHGEGVSLALQLRAPESVWPGGPPGGVVEEIRRVAPGAAVASMSRVGEELRDLARADLRRLAGGAAGVVLLVVLLSFRGHAVRTVLALVPIGLGSIWCLGLWGLAGRPLDLVSLAVLPILFGVGIDDGLHVLHAWRLAPEAGMAGAVRESGRAIVLTTLTTAVAFSSLAATTVPGLRSAGLLVTLGVFGCLAATLTLPALTRALGVGEPS